MKILRRHYKSYRHLVLILSFQTQKYKSKFHSLYLYIVIRNKCSISSVKLDEIRIRKRLRNTVKIFFLKHWIFIALSWVILMGNNLEIPISWFCSNWSGFNSKKPHCLITNKIIHNFQERKITFSILFKVEEATNFLQVETTIYVKADGQ